MLTNASEQSRKLFSLPSRRPLSLAKIAFFQMIRVLFISDLNECTPDPCQNGATCVDELFDYRCMCVDGYDGVNCQIGTPLSVQPRD